MNEIITKNVTLSENGVISLMLPHGELMALSEFEELTRPERRRILKDMRTLAKDIYFLSSNNSLNSREATRYGVASFSEIVKCLGNGELDNDTNRDEELEEVGDYQKKLHHLIRYVSGISSKQQLLASVLRDRNNKVAYIRDDGTFVSLFDPKKFFTHKKITGYDWCNMVDDIMEVYDVDIKDQTFIDSISNFFEPMTESLKDRAYSLEDIVTSSDEINDYFYSTQLPYEINLFSKKYHILDMQNANKPMNIWEAYNYYMTPHKDTDEYRQHFLGTDLLNYFKDKDGTANFKSNKILSKRALEAKKKRVNKVIPVYMAYCVSRYCDTAEDLINASVKINAFSDWNNSAVNDYWTDMFAKMVSEVRYKDMIDFYEDEYLKVFRHDDWKRTIDTLNSIRNNHSDIGSANAYEQLYVKKYSTGIWFMSNAIWFKYHNNRLGWDKIVNYIVESYIKLLNNTIQHTYDDGTSVDVPLWEYFGTLSNVYKTTNALARKNKLFKYVVTDVDGKIKGRKKDRSIEAKLREASLSKHSIAMTNNANSIVLSLYPLSTEDIHKISFNTDSDKVEWIHPNDEENKADDGFLGLYDDNHHADWKDLNWKKFGVNSQKDYWTKILERNIDILETIDDKITKWNVEKSVTSLSSILECDLEVK